MIMAHVPGVGWISRRPHRSSGLHTAEPAQRDAVAGPGSPGRRWRQDRNPGILPPEHEPDHIPHVSPSRQHLCGPLGTPSNRSCRLLERKVSPESLPPLYLEGQVETCCPC